MSLSNLPVELIDQISNYLEYFDICILMETSAKNYNTIKAYGKDKLKLSVLKFSNKDDQLTITAMDLNRKIYSFKDLNTLEGQTVDNIKTVLAECASVEKLAFVQITISDIMNILKATNLMISHIEVHPDHMPLIVDEVLELCGAVEKVCICPHYRHFDPTFWNDDVLTQLLPAAIVDLRTFLVLSCFFNGNPYSPFPITDRTLNALVAEDEVQDKFSIRGVYNQITVEGIVKLIEILEDSQITGFVYDFGILPSDQNDDADFYFGEDGEMNDIYKIEIEIDEDEDVWENPRTNYNIEGRVDWFSITFSVAHY